jgi:hypothetical protein
MELAFMLLVITATVIKELSIRSNPQAVLKQKQR